MDRDYTVIDIKAEGYYEGYDAGYIDGLLESQRIKEKASKADSEE